MNDFRDLVDTEGLSPDEEARLRHVHELLLEAGPPADLPPALDKPPTEVADAEILQFPSLPGRRWSVAFVAAAAVAAAAFGGGYLFGHSKARTASFAEQRSVTMVALHPGQPGLAVLKLAAADSVGNWPMDMQVTGLPKQSQPGAYYELWLTKGGKAVAPCGTFRVHGKTTTIRFTVPYRLRNYDGWIVTAHRPGQAEPGRVVLTT
jgi:hypothetical protein